MKACIGVRCCEFCNVKCESLGADALKFIHDISYDEYCMRII